MIAQASSFCHHTHELDQYLSGLCPRGLQGTWAEWSYDSSGDWGASQGLSVVFYWASYGYYWSHSHSWAEHTSLFPGG